MKAPKEVKWSELPDSVREFITTHVHARVVADANAYGWWFRFGRGGFKCVAGWSGELEVIYRSYPAESVQVIRYEINEG
jgi:hypothetical protein